MVCYCNDCRGYVNQKCDRCGDNFGISLCEKYACGGTMRCPECKGNNLSKKKEFGADPYDYVKKMRDAKEKGIPLVTKGMCACGFRLENGWIYCPMCGVKKA